jgi:hypothetical protein
MLADFKPEKGRIHDTGFSDTPLGCSFVRLLSPQQTWAGKELQWGGMSVP